MSRHPKFFNPFFLLLGAVGAVFAVSAFVYGMMTLQFSHAVGDWTQQPADHPLIVFFREHGTLILTVELVALACLTVAAISTDDYWARRAHRRQSD